MEIFDVILFVTAVFAGAIASVAGFGIGSLVTPVLSLSLGTKLAIALVSVPHLVATGLRFFMLRSHVDRKILLSFGIMSVLGGLTGAFLNIWIDTSALTFIFGLILTFTGLMGVTGGAEKLRFHGVFAWIAGAVSGFLGGLVGNQGGIRTAALLGAKISKETFVATATATGLLVDFARMPVYFWQSSSQIFANSFLVAVSCAGVVAGTLLGMKTLKRIPERQFKKVVSLLVLALGLFMIYQGF